MPCVNLIGGGVGRFPAPTTKYYTVTIDTSNGQPYVRYNGVSYTSTLKVPANTVVQLCDSNSPWNGDSFNGQASRDVIVNGIDMGETVPVSYTVNQDITVKLSTDDNALR
jgi:hypothetical protein